MIPFTIPKSYHELLKEAWGIPPKQCPTCPKCSKQSVWKDWGPNVGQGYFCETCRDDVDHPDNVYGLIASSKRKSAVKASSSDDEYDYQPLMCTKPQCMNCMNVYQSVMTSPIIGDFIKCVNNGGIGKSLQLNGRYKVIATTPSGVIVQVGSAQKEYTRCRFQLEVKKVKTA